MTVYLLHFEQAIGDPENPHGQAQHYIGWADDVDARLVEHSRGWGAAITAFCVEQGIGWQLARTWPGGDRRLERRLKNRKEAPRLCPVCSGEHAWALANYGNGRSKGDD